MLIRSGDMAKILGVTRNTIVNMANDGRIPCIRLPSGHYRFDPEEVLKQMRVGEVKKNED